MVKLYTIFECMNFSIGFGEYQMVFYKFNITLPNIVGLLDNLNFAEGSLKLMVIFKNNLILEKL